MEKTGKLIIASLLSCIALVVGGISFSFAWYGNHTDLRFETVRIEADLERKLEISLSDDLETFGDFLSIEDEKIANPGYFTPVSPIFRSSWDASNKAPTFYDVSYYGTDLAGVPFKKKASKGFFNVDFYIRCDDDVMVSLDPKRTVAMEDSAKNASYATYLANLKDAEYTEAEYRNRLKAGVDSLRLGFYIDDKFTVIDPLSPARTLQGGILDNDKDGYYDYYYDSDSGNYYEVFYGEANHREKLVYDSPLASDSAAPSEFTSFDAMHKAGIYRLNIQKSVQNGAEILEEEAFGLSSLDVDFPPFEFSLDAFVPKKVNMSVYLEGWDEDSVNGGMGSSFLSNIVFKIVRLL